jgi:phage terminase large subunit-like protein
MRDLVQLADKLTSGHGVTLLIPSGSPALAWKADLESANVPVEVVPPAECSAAFGYLLSTVNDGSLRHRGQPEMNNAIAGLAVKSSGDVDVPTRRNSSSNIAPIMAAMVALYRVPTSDETAEIFVEYG